MLDLVYKNETGDAVWSKSFFRRVLDAVVVHLDLNENGLEKYDILPVGDIFICLEIARKQADEMDIPLNQELARLAVHGFLHLLGYDHETSPEDEKRMIDLQEEILDTIPNF